MLVWIFERLYGICLCCEGGGNIAATVMQAILNPKYVPKHC